MANNSKPGEAFNNPLRPNTPAAPYYVQVPITIDIVNASPAALSEWLAGETPQRDAHGDALVTIPSLSGNTSVGVPPPANAAGSRLLGSGTKDDPYRTTGTLYATAPVTFAFVGTEPAALDLNAKGRWLFATSG